MLMPWHHTPALLSAWVRLASYVNNYLRTICMHVINERSNVSRLRLNRKMHGGGSYMYRRRFGTCAVSRTPMLLWSRPGICLVAAH